MIDERLILEIQTISIIHIVAIIIATILLVVFYYKAYNEKSIKSFLIVQLSMIFWMVFKIFKTISPTVEIRWVFIVLYYICTCVLEVAFLEFAYTYNKGEKLSRKVRCPIYFIAFLQMTVVVTNPYHHLFYKTYDFWHDTFGPLFYVHSGIEYVMIGIGFIYCYFTFKKRFVNKPMGIKLLVSVAIVLPLIGNFLFITKRLHTFLSFIGVPFAFDITPIVFTWSLLIFVYVTFKSDFMEVTPIMRHEIITKLNMPIILFDEKYNLLFINEKADDDLKYNKEEIIAVIRDAIINEHKENIEIEGKTFNIRIERILENTSSQYLVTYNDLSEYIKIKNDINTSKMLLEESNRELNQGIRKKEKLSKEKAKYFIASELHDIIGHSLVLTTKLLEVAKLSIKSNEEVSRNALLDAARSLDKGYIKMLSISEGKSGEYTGEALNELLIEMLNSYKKTGINGKIIMMGKAVSLNDKVFNTIIKSTTELVTNTVKHGEANNVFININLKEDSVDYLFMDDGIGTDKLVRGNGLKGIVRRVDNIGGTVAFNTSKDNGFLCKLNIVI